MKHHILISVMIGFILSSCGGGGSTTTSRSTLPSLSITAASIQEGVGNLDFTVTANRASTTDITFNYATSDGTAQAGSDYTAIASTSLTIAAGQTTTTATVTIPNDTLFENDETLTVALSNPNGATIGTTSAIGTITNDDAKPTVSIANASVVEGDTGLVNLVFTVSLSTQSGLPVTVNYATTNGTASQASDYTATSGTLTIQPNTTSNTIKVPISVDTLFEGDETITMTLNSLSNTTAVFPAAATSISSTGTITEDDAVGMTISGKSLDFTWKSNTTIDQNTTVDHFRILVNPDGASGFSPITGASNIANSANSFSLEIPVHKTNWVSAKYIIEACNINNTTCVSGSSNTLALIDSIAATFYIKASNTGNIDQFGYSLSLSKDGNTLAVGAVGEGSAATGINGNQGDDTAAGAGAVYIFSRTGTTWVQQAYLKASNTNAVDRFGWSVALDSNGNTLAVGANYEQSIAKGIGGNQTDNTNSQSGATYIFSRTGTTWIQQAYIKASNSGPFQMFGYSMALSSDGNTVAIGAVTEDSVATGINGNQANTAATAAGAVYIFTRTGTVWMQQAYVKSFNSGAGDWFGFSISLSDDGNTLAVGSHWEDSAATGINGNQMDNTALDAGAVYIFSRTGTTWVQQAYLKASNTNAGDHFGWSVALDSTGNTLAVGAAHEDSVATGINGDSTNNASVNSGAAYIFSRTNVTWTQQAYLKASNTGAGHLFGFSIDLDATGDTLIIGSYWEGSTASGIGGSQANNTLLGVGAAYLFSRISTAWVQQSYVKASNSQKDHFGKSVTISSNGNTLAVSSDQESSAATGINNTVPGQTDNSFIAPGAVYLY